METGRAYSVSSKTPRAASHQPGSAIGATMIGKGVLEAASPTVTAMGTTTALTTTAAPTTLRTSRILTRFCTSACTRVRIW